MFRMMRLSLRYHGAVAFLLLFACAFIGAPVNVFSQSPDETAVVEDVAEAVAPEAEIEFGDTEDEAAFTEDDEEGGGVITPTPAVPPYRLDALPNETVFGDFVVGPGKFELELAPGQSQTILLTVANRMGEEKRFSIAFEDMTGSEQGETAVVLLGDERGPYTLRDYLSVPALEFDVPHAHRAQVPVTVHLPADAEPGGRYGSVVVSTISRDADLNPADGAVPSSAIISRIGTLFFITTPGTVAREGRLVSFSTVGNRALYSTGPISFSVVYENTGSVHLNPYGELRVHNMFGREVGFSALEPWFAMPQSLRTREVSWDRELLFGRYTVTLALNRGYDDVVDELQTSFWVVPWSLVAAIFGILFVVILVLRLIFSRFEVRRR